MTGEDRKRSRPLSNYLHPLVYLAAVGLGLWFVLAVWVFFGGYHDMELPLWVVSGLFIMAVGIPSAIWLTWSRRADVHNSKRPSLRDWAAGDFDTAQGRRKAASAAVEMLLPIAAAAFGMTALGIVFYVSARVAAAGA